jgi:uncharacterized membrane protein
MPWRAEPAQSRDARAGRDLRKCGKSPSSPQGMGRDPDWAVRVGNHGLISDQASSCGATPEQRRVRLMVERCPLKWSVIWPSV